MYDTLAERLAQAREFIDAVGQLITQLLSNHGEQAIRPEVNNRIYMMCSELHTILCTSILGDEECQLEMDAIYCDREASVNFRGVLRDARQALIKAVMDMFPISFDETQPLSGGRVALPSLLLLCVAALQRLETDLDPEAMEKKTFSRDFRCVRRWALQGSEEQVHTPIESLSVHGIMNALYALYAATPIASYSPELERYTSQILRRTMEILMVPGDSDVWNIHAYREAIRSAADPRQGETDKMFRFSARMLRDVTLSWHALSDHFDLAHLLPMEHDPRRVCEPTNDQMKLARDWLFRNVVSELDTWVRDQLVMLSMRAGEMDFYHADHRAEHSTPHLVLRDHRVADYYRLMETAPMSARHVLHLDLMSATEFEREGARAQRETLHAGLVILTTFKSRLKAAEKSLDPNAYVVMSHELRQWSPYLMRCTGRPILVLLYNHVQLWFGGRLLMYNSAIEALCAWMLIVDTQCARRVDNHSVGALLDDFLRPTEEAGERVARLAAMNSTQPPPLGSGGVF